MPTTINVNECKTKESSSNDETRLFGITITSCVPVVIAALLIRERQGEESAAAALITAEGSLPMKYQTSGTPGRIPVQTKSAQRVCSTNSAVSRDDNRTKRKSYGLTTSGHGTNIQKVRAPLPNLSPSLW